MAVVAPACWSQPLTLGFPDTGSYKRLPQRKEKKQLIKAYAQPPDRFSLDPNETGAGSPRGPFEFPLNLAQLAPLP